MVRDCCVKIDLVSVHYTGTDIGTDWSFDITFTPPGEVVTIPRHQLKLGETKTYNKNIVDCNMGPCDPGPQFHVLITARERDWLVDDVANHRIITPVFPCTDEPCTERFFTRFKVTEKPVVIPRFGTLELIFDVTLTRVD